MAVTGGTSTVLEVRFVRRCTAAVLVVGLVLGAAVEAATAAKPPSGGGGGSTCALVPQLRDTTVNQGLGSYTPLVRGKETLVRLFLSLPSCAGSTASIALTGATLTVTGGGQTLASGLGPTPAPASPFPLVAPAASAPLLDAPGDPVFVVRGSVLRPTATGAFTASFRATVSFTAKTSNAATPVAGSLTFPIFSRPVAAQSNGLRVLVQPMGNGADTYANQFGDPARMAVQNGMATLGRIFPVPDGIGDLASRATPAPGLRYTINPTLLDIGTTPYCGTAANFSTVKGRLAQFLQSWNTANPSAPADVVLGVIDAGRSSGANSGCAEGMAAVGEPLAWVRAIPDATGAPSTTGGLAALELAHTLGLIPTTRDDPFNTFHSPNANADATAPNRAYNVSQRAFLADDRTVMNLTGAWNNNTTIFEAADWAFVLCKLGGTTTTECATPGVVGAPAGADPVLVMSGTTDGTPAGTSVVESYFALGGLRSEPDPSSPYRLVQKQGSAVLSDVGVDVAFDGSEHGSSDDPEVGVFSFALPFSTAATRIELQEGGEVLYAANRNLDPTTLADLLPRFRLPVSLGTGAATAPTNFTNSAIEPDATPALTTDGQLVAWKRESEAPGLYIAPTSDADAAVHIPGTGAESSDPAWSFDRQCVAWAENDLDVDVNSFEIRTAKVVVDGDTGEITVGSPLTLFASSTDRVSDPTWAPEAVTAAGVDIAFEMRDELHVITSNCDAPVISIAALTSTPTLLTPDDDGAFALDPSWSATAGDRRIAFAQWVPVSGTEFAFHRELALLDPDTGDIEVLVEDPSADRGVSAPSFGTTGEIAFQRDTAAGEGADEELWLVAASAGATPRKLTDGPTDAEPALAGRTVAFERPAGSFDDIFLLSLSGRPRLRAVGFSPGGTATVAPEDLRLDLFLACEEAGPHFPLAVGLAPTGTDGGDAIWEHDVDSTLACSQGTPTVTGVISDGFLRSDTTDPDASVPVDSEPKPPVAEIYAPRVAGPDEPLGTEVLQHDGIALFGSGKDPEDGELTDLQWFLDGSPVATGPAADLPPQAPGVHTVELVVTDSDGNEASTTRAVNVLADGDNDGIAATAETPCGSDADPFDAFGDADGDGIPGVDDYTLTGEPCVASTAPYGAEVTISPDVLNLGSTGTPVTVRIQVPYRDERHIDVASVALSFDGSPDCPPASFRPPYQGTIKDGDLILKFDRVAINEYFSAAGCDGMRATVVGRVTGSGTTAGTTWSFAGSDSFEIL